MPDAVVHGTIDTGAAQEIGATRQGRLMVDSAFSAGSVDAFERLRVSAPQTLFDSFHRFTDNGLWATATASGGAAVFNANQGLVDLNVTSASGSEVLRETRKVFPYQPGKSLRVDCSFVFNSPKPGLRQRAGYFDSQNGHFVEMTDSASGFCFVERSFVTGSVVETKASRLGGAYGVSDTGWNYDRLDGSGPSKIVLDPTASQIFALDLEWLGVGTACVGFYINRRFIPCHLFNHANIIKTTYTTTACLPLRYEITNTSATTSASTLKQICSTVISEGGYELRGAPGTIGQAIGSPYSLAVAATRYPIVALRLKAAQLNSIVVPTAAYLMGVGNNHAYKWEVVTDCSITGGAWISAGANSSLEYNMTGAAIVGGAARASGFFSSSNQSTAMANVLRDQFLGLQLERDPFTATPSVFALVASCDTASSSVYGSVDWEQVTH
jgi:hypothetical protein